METIDLYHVIHEYFSYREDGVLINKKSRRGVVVGDVAGCFSTQIQRRLIGIKRKQYLASRLIFLYHHGWLPNEVDHININCSDDRIENLREATRSQNLANTRKKPNRTSKYKGVYFQKSRNKWQSRITFNGKMKYIGNFVNEIDAAKAYDEIAKKYFGDFANLNFQQKP